MIGVRHLRILAHQDARQHLDLRHLGAEAREGLGQLGADRTATEHDQPRGQRHAEPRSCPRSDTPISSMPGIGGTNGRAPAAMTIARVGQRAPLSVRKRDLDLPRRDDLGRTLEALDAHRAVALDRVVRLDRLDDPLHALHHVGEIELGACAA